MHEQARSRPCPAFSQRAGRFPSAGQAWKEPNLAAPLISSRYIVRYVCIAGLTSVSRTFCAVQLGSQQWLM